MSHVSYLHGLTPKNWNKTLEELALKITLHHEGCNIIAGRGMSGAMIVPALAHRLNVDWCIVRKTIHDCHSGFRAEASNWPDSPKIVFVDDIVDSGTTFRETVRSVKEHCCGAEFLGLVMYYQTPGSIRQLNLSTIFNLPLTTIVR